MKIRIEPERCQGHNRCCALAPELFESDELGNGQVKGGGTVPPGLEAKARLALRNCPEYAVRIED